MNDPTDSVDGARQVQPVPLPAEFTIGTLPALYAEVSRHRDSDIPYLLDATLVKRVDAAALQFLVMCQCSLPSLDDDVLCAASEVLQQGIDDLGLTRCIGVAS